MEDEDAKPASRKQGLGKYLWVFVVIALVILWWYYRKGKGDLHDDVLPAQASAEGADPDDILVDLADSETPDQVAAIDRELGIDLQLVDDTAKDSQLYRAHVDPAREQDILAALAKRADVEIAEPDSEMSIGAVEQADEVAAAEDAASPGLAGARSDAERREGLIEAAKQPGYPNDPMYPKQWHLRSIGMPEAWKLADGNGVVVAVLDTGVAYENYGKFKVLPDLEGITFVDPYNFVNNTTHANDDHAHGSHVTGTIAQVTNNGIGVAGVARNVKIMPLKVLSAGGSGSVAGIADAIRFAANHNAKVINMSLGGPFPSNVLKKAVKYAHDKGVTVICAAGNESKSKVGYPAAYPGAVAVSATRGDDAVTFYSNTGKDIDIAAPGGDTTDGKGNRNNPDGGVLQNTIAINDPTKSVYAAFMGTSMAAPHAAGVAALVAGEGVTNPDQVEKILKETARKPASGYTADKYGAGIIDAPAAVLKARSQGGGFQFGLGLLMAGAVAASLKRRTVKLGVGYLGGVLIGSAGLFFLPFIAPSVSSLPVIHTLTHGLPSWDMGILGVGGHGNALFFSAAIPLVLLAIGFSVKRLRAILVGVAIGVAAHLAFFAVVPMAQLHYVPAAFGVSAMWLGLNAIVCLALARVALRD